MPFWITELISATNGKWSNILNLIVLRGIVGLLAGLTVISPAIVGVFYPSIPLMIIIAGVTGGATVLALSLRDNVAVLQRGIIVVVSLSATILAIDLASRTLLRPILYPFERSMFVRQWPPLPDLSRYARTVSFNGRLYGDSASVPGFRDYREYREIRFQTDRYGFRNDVSDPEQVDIVVLSDSLGAGNGTTQDQIWANVLADQSGLSVYNLSMAADSPWQECMNLAVEIDRLNVHNETIVIWMLFSGNDLYDPDYSAILNPSQFPWNSPWEAFLVSVRSYRARSPLRLLRLRLDHGMQVPPVLVRDFLDGSKMLFRESYVKRLAATVDDVREHENFESLEATIVAMNDLASDYGITPVIVLAPSKPEVYSWVLMGGAPWTADESPSGLSTVIHEIAAREQMCFLDLKPSLVQESRIAYEDTGALLWWRDDTHWNSHGHEVVANLLRDSLSSGETTPCWE